MQEPSYTFLLPLFVVYNILVGRHYFLFEVG